MSDDANTSNIVQFPIRHCRPEILSEEIAKRNDAAKVYYVTDITMRFLEQAAEAFLQMGIDVEEEPFVKDFAYFQLVVEGIFARSAEMNHTIHLVMDAGKAAKDPEGHTRYIWPNSQEKAPKKASRAATSNTGAVPNDSG